MRSASSSSSSSFALGLASGAALGVGAVVGRKVVGVVRGGRGHPLEHRVLDLAASLLQRKRPLSAISTCLSGFHFYADDPGRQVEATHLCNHRRHDLHQCVIYDSDAPDARLIGIEYIVSAERFAALPEDEKRLWHSHHHEVTSGVLIAPGVPQPAEHAFLRDLATTYGKTFHTWQYDRDPEVPLGPPQLMMAFTADGQERRDLVDDRDRRLGVSSERRRQQRADTTPPEPLPGANSWESGTVPQVRVEDVPVSRGGARP